MKNLEIEKYGVQELNSHELTSLNGGGWWSDFKKGFQEGFDWMYKFVDGLSDIFK